MRRLAATVALGWLATAIAGSAGAQEIPNPRNTTGVARNEQNDPAGQLTIRAVQGLFSADQFGNSTTKFPRGTLVHLVAVGADGSVSKMSRPIDDGGRAIFTGLATDGSYTYYATTIFSRGEHQDLLVGREPITMPPQGGVRMILAGLDPDSTEPGVDDQNDSRLPPLDAGNVVIDVRGMFEGVEQITLREIGTQWTMTVAAEGLADAKAARFQNVPFGNDHVYIGEVVVGGRVYRSQPLQLTNARGGYGSVFVYPNLLLQFHTGAEADDEKLWFQIQFTMGNATGTPFSPGPEGIVIPLPRGTVNASIMGEDPRVRVDKERGAFIWKGSFPPGEAQFMGQFAIPIEDGEAKLDMELPYGSIESQVSIRVHGGAPEAVEECVRAGGKRLDCEKREAAKLVDVELPQKTMQRFRTLDGNVTFLVIPGINVRAGDRMRMTFKGLPKPPAWKAPGELIAGLAVLAFIGLAIFGVFWYRGGGEAVAEGRRAELTLERDNLFEKLVQLEKSQREGRVPDGRYSSQRAELKSKLVSIDEELRGIR